MWHQLKSSFTVWKYIRLFLGGDWHVLGINRVWKTSQWHITGLCPRAKALSQTWWPLCPRAHGLEDGVRAWLRLSSANLLPGSENQLQAPTLSINTHINSLFVLQKLSMHSLPCVQVLFTPWWERHASSFQNLTFSPFQGSAPVSPSWKAFPYCLRPHGWLLSQNNATCLPCTTLILTTTLTASKQGIICRIWNKIQMMTCLYLAPYNYNSCPTLQPHAFQGANTQAFYQVFVCLFVFKILF